MLTLERMRSLTQDGRAEDAARLGLESLRSGGDKASIYHAIGDAFFNLGMNRLAEGHYRDALASGSTSPWTDFNLGRALECLGDQSAILHIDKALSKSNNPDFLFAKAKSKFTSDNIRKQMFRELLLINRKYLFQDWGIQHLYPKGMRGDLHDVISRKRKSIWFEASSKKYDDRFRPLADLVRKDHAAKIVSRMGLRVPRCLASGKLKDLPGTFSEIRFVLKPRTGASSKGISLVDNNFELFRRKAFSGSFLDLYSADHQKWMDRDFLVEELIKDVDSTKNPFMNIPRDFKCFAANGEFFWVNIYDRNYPNGSDMTVSSYDENWKRLPRTTDSYRDSSSYDKPKFFSELVEAVKRLSREIPYVMRYDFFLSTEGPVFGEFTHVPSDGLNQTEFGERTQLQLLFCYPDTIEPIHNEQALTL